MLLIVDDEASHLDSLRLVFERAGHSVECAASAELALDIVREHPINVILTDLMLPGMSGEDLMRAARAVRPSLDVILMTGYGTVDNAVSAMRAGAYDFVQKPVKSAVVRRVVERCFQQQALTAENLSLKQHLQEATTSNDTGLRVVGRSPAIVLMMETVQQAADSEATVLLIGESGTGKALVAKALHDCSPRADGPMVTVNCAAIPQTVVEAELFGPETQQTGPLFEKARSGTLFIGEVEALSPALQGRLLRALESRESSADDAAGACPRLVVASDQELLPLVEEGRLRKDLYYHLNVIQIPVPPLRERPEDIGLLAEHFVRSCAHRNGRLPPKLSRHALEILQRYSWPGNVRELENAIERAVVLATGPELDTQDFPESLRRGADSPRTVHREGRNLVIPVGTRLETVERALIRETLKETGGDKTLAAQLLGIAARTIYRRLETERAEEDHRKRRSDEEKS